MINVSTISVKKSGPAITMSKCVHIACSIAMNNVELKSNVLHIRARQNDGHFPEDVLKWIFLNENLWVSIKNLLKLVPNGFIWTNGG